MSLPIHITARAVGFAFAVLFSTTALVALAESPELSETSVNRSPDASSLEAWGLSGLARLDDGAGDSVRGMASGGGRASGMSFVAGMLYDPVSSSTLRGSNSNSTAANGGRAEVAQLSVLRLGMTIRHDTGSVFNGSLFGIASGHGLAKP